MNKVRFVLYGFLVLAVLTSCDTLFAPLSDSNAEALTESVMTGVGTAVSAAIQDGLRYSVLSPSDQAQPEARASSTISYSGSGYRVSGQFGSTGGNLTVAFYGYSHSGIVFNSGTAKYIINISSTGTFSGTYSGSFNITYQGKKYTYDWSIQVSGTSSGVSYSGSYTINGHRYRYTGSGSGSSGGSGGSGGSGTTQKGFCFYVSNTSAVGTVSIYIDNSLVGSLSVHFPSGTPTWGQTGTLVVSRNPGTYSIRAVDQGGRTWGPESRTLTTSTPGMFINFQ